MRKSLSLFMLLSVTILSGFVTRAQNFQWINEAVSTGNMGTAIIRTSHTPSADIVYAAGVFTTDFIMQDSLYQTQAGNTWNNGFIARKNASGEIIWLKTFSSPIYSAEPLALTTDENDDLYMLFECQTENMIYDGILIENAAAPFQGRIMKINPEDGSFVQIVPVATNLLGIGIANFLLIKRFYIYNQKVYLAYGNTIWGFDVATQSTLFNHQLTDTGHWLYPPIIESLHFDGEKILLGGYSHGGTIAVGDSTITVPTNGARGILYAMLDTLGTVEWIRAYGNTAGPNMHSSVTHIEKHPNGNYVLATNHTNGFELDGLFFESFGNTQYKAGVLTISPEGQPLFTFSCNSIGVYTHTSQPKLGIFENGTTVLAAAYSNGYVGVGDYIFLLGAGGNMFWASFTDELELIEAQRLTLNTHSNAFDVSSSGHNHLYITGSIAGAVNAQLGCLQSESQGHGYMGAMKNEPIPYPVASFTPTVSANQVFLQADIDNATGYHWSFGDGNTSTQLNPSHTYQQPGVYDVCLTLTNHCGSINICETIHLAGIKNIFPTHHANQGFLKADVRGALFEPGSEIKLISDDLEEIAAVDMIFVNPSFLQPMFLFDGQSPGFYHLVIQSPDESRIDTLFYAFELQDAELPQVWAEIQAPAFARPFLDYKVSALVGNNGNTAVYGVPVMINWPVSFEVKSINVNHQDGLPDIIYENTNHVWQFFDTIAQKDVQIGYYLIPKINPGEVVSIDFWIRFPFSLDETHEITIHTGYPIIDQSDVIPGLKTNCGGGQGCIACMLDILSFVPYADCIVGIVDIGCTVYNMVTNAHDNNFIDLLGSLGGTLFSCFDVTGLGKALTIAKAVAEFASGVNDYFSMISSCAPGSCIPAPAGWSTQNITFINSFDPNIKLGPAGYGEANYIRGTGTFPYIIMFENLEDATAAAYKVLITDTIDSSYLNLETFSFMSFGFGDTTIVLGQSNLKEFIYEVDLRPTQNSVVRVTGEIDMETGEVTVLFLSLDADTMEPETDPFAGFLPPNVNSPEGEGFVTFIISPQPELDHLDAVENYASIIFDENEPIITPLWINVIDREAPVSSIVDLPEIIYTNTFNITWQAEDAHSGVRQIFIFMAEDEEEFNLLHIADSPGELTIEGEFGKTYSFYSIAADKLFNQEIKPGDGYYEARVTLVMPQYAVTYEVLAGEGELEAFADGSSFPSGTPIDQGTDILFVATPENNYKVKAWIINGETLENNNDNEITVENLLGDLSVLVEFELSTFADIHLADQVIVYPNPFNNTLNLQNITGIRQVILMNITGQVMRVLDVNQSENITLQTEGLQPGIYLLRLIAHDGSVHTFKVSKI
jgi:hypothetical protein